METKTQKNKGNVTDLTKKSETTKKVTASNKPINVKKDTKGTTTVKKTTAPKKASVIKKITTPQKVASSKKVTSSKKEIIESVVDEVQSNIIEKDINSEPVQIPKEILENPNISPIFDISFYRDVFMSLRSQLDKLYEKREKSEKDFDAYDDAVYNITVSAMDDAGAQDFMSYCYKRGKYDFCLMNYEKFMKWSFLAAANGNAFALSKLQIFLMNSIDNILSTGDHSYILGFLDLNIDNYIIFLSKLVCDEIVKIMDISPISLAKMPETYLEQNEQIQRDFDNIKIQAAEKVTNYLITISSQLKEYVDSQIEEEKEIRRQKIEQSKQKIKEETDTEQISNEEEKEEITPEKKESKRVSVKKFRW